MGRAGHQGFGGRFHAFLVGEDRAIDRQIYGMDGDFPKQVLPVEKALWQGK